MVNKKNLLGENTSDLSKATLLLSQRLEITKDWRHQHCHLTGQGGNRQMYWSEKKETLGSVATGICGLK